MHTTTGRVARAGTRKALQLMHVQGQGKQCAAASLIARCEDRRLPDSMGRRGAVCQTAAKSVVSETGQGLACVLPAPDSPTSSVTCPSRMPPPRTPSSLLQLMGWSRTVCRENECALSSMLTSWACMQQLKRHEAQSHEDLRESETKRYIMPREEELLHLGLPVGMRRPLSANRLQPFATRGTTCCSMCSSSALRAWHGTKCILGSHSIPSRAADLQHQVAFNVQACSHHGYLLAPFLAAVAGRDLRDV